MSLAAASGEGLDEVFALSKEAADAVTDLLVEHPEVAEIVVRAEARVGHDLEVAGPASRDA
jgi:predicted RNase H-like HicB family nuclease